MSWQIFKIANIPLKIHVLWIIWAAVLTLPFINDPLNSPVRIYYIAIISVILHEYGHALTAKYLNYEVQQILITPLGGIASIDADFENVPKHELLITLNGPAVNAIIAILLFPFSHNLHLFNNSLATANIIDQIVTINLALLFFNLLPTWPMDGGRLLHATIHMLTTKEKAITYSIHSTMAIIATTTPLITFYYHPLPAFIIITICLYANFKRIKELDVPNEPEILEIFNEKSKQEIYNKQTQQLKYFNIAQSIVICSCYNDDKSIQPTVNAIQKLSHIVHLHQYEFQNLEIEQIADFLRKYDICDAQDF